MQSLQVFPASASSAVPSLPSNSTVYLKGAQTLSSSSLFLVFFLCVICLFWVLCFRLGVALQRSFCISVFLSFRLGVTLQLCFVFAVCLCFFLSARLVVIHFCCFCLPCCLVRNHADLKCFLLAVFLSSSFRRSICIFCFHTVSMRFVGFKSSLLFY